MTARQFSWTALAAWLIAVLALASQGLFERPAGQPPLPILAGVLLPLAAFAVLYRASRAFRDLVLSADLRLVGAIQAWRWAGIGFLSLWTYGVLPGLFAWSAGLGDMAVGFAAPWIVLALARDPAFAASRRFALWNGFGILDLVVAVSLGGLSSVIALGDATTAPMARLPLVLIPGFLVPLFLMLHVTALLQARRARALSRSARQGGAAGSGAPAPAW